MNCSKCGRKLKKGQTVCPQCGAGMNEEYGFSAQEDQFISREDAFDQGMNEFPSDGAAAVIRPRRQSGALKWLLALAAVLVVGAAAVLLLLPREEKEDFSVRGFAAPTGQWEWIDQGRRLLTNELLVTLSEEGSKATLEANLESLDGAIVGYFADLRQCQVRFNTSGREELERMKTALEGAEGVARVDWNLLILPEEDSLAAGAGGYPAGQGETIGLLGAVLPSEEGKALFLPSHTVTNPEEIPQDAELPETRNAKATAEMADGRNLITASCFYLERNPDGTLSRTTTTGAIRYQIAQLVHGGAGVIAFPVSCASGMPAGEDPWLSAEAEQTGMLYAALEKEHPDFLIVGSAAVLSAEYLQDETPRAGDFLSGLLGAGNGDHLILTAALRDGTADTMLSMEPNGLPAFRLTGWTDASVNFCAEGTPFDAAVLTALRAANARGKDAGISREGILRSLTAEATGLAAETGRNTEVCPVLAGQAGSNGLTPDTLEQYAAFRLTVRDDVTDSPVFPVKIRVGGGAGETELTAAAPEAWILTRDGRIQATAEAEGYAPETVTGLLSGEEKARRRGDVAVKLSGSRAGTVGTVSGTIRFPGGNAGDVRVRCVNAETGETLEIPAGASWSSRLYAGTWEMTFFGLDMNPVTVHQVAVAAGEETQIPEIEMNRAYDLPGKVSGLVRNAMTGQSMDGVQVELFEGVDSPMTGSPAASLTTGSDGKYTLQLPAGAYTIRASRDGFIEMSRNVFLRGDQPNADQDFILSPKLLEGQVRIVLEWGMSPKDLDSHLVNQTQGVHIYYENKTMLTVNPPNLDRDDTDYEGPETTTIPVQYPGKYTFYVQDFTNHSITRNCRELADSGARVTVYLDNGTPMTFTVPDQEGTLWEVFTLENGVVTPSGRMTYFTGIKEVGQ